MTCALPRFSRSAIAALVLLGIPALAGAETKETERVEKTVPFTHGGTLKLKNFSGNVEITGEDRSDVTLVAVRTAKRERLDHVKLDIQTSGDTVTIDANKRDDSWEHHDDNVVETAFTIRVPKNANLDVDVFSSAVTVTGVAGRHHVHGFSSEVRLNGSTGSIDAETFSGGIHLAPATWVKDQSVRAKTFSGDIEVTLPASATGSVEFDSFSGDMSSDVPMTFQDKTRRSLHARLGSGGDGSLSFHTFSGDVRLKK